MKVVPAEFELDDLEDEVEYDDVAVAHGGNDRVTEVLVPSPSNQACDKVETSCRLTR